MAKINVEKFFRGRSHRFGEGASDPRESGAKQRGYRTIREYRDLSAAKADRRED